MQGIAKHRYTASAFYEGVCRVSVRLSAPKRVKWHRKAWHWSATYRKAKR